jgi:hypothetical protein
MGREVKSVLSLDRRHVLYDATLMSLHLRVHPHAYKTPFQSGLESLLRAPFKSRLNWQVVLADTVLLVFISRSSTIHFLFIFLGSRTFIYLLALSSLIKWL